MSRSLPYDSEPGRAYAAAITALMCGEAYKTVGAGSRPTRPARSRATPTTRPRSSRSCASTAPRVDRIDAALVPYELMQAARDAWDDAIELGQQVRLPQRPDDRARADRHDRVPHGLRHHRRRARHRDRQVQAPRRRRPAQDRQPHRPRGAAPSSATPTRRSRRSSRYIDANDTIEGAPAPQGRAPAGVRLRVPLVERHPLDPLHGPHPHDGGGPAVPLGRDLQDRQPADRLHGRGHRGRVHPGVEARPQGDRGLPRRLQAHPAAVDEPQAGDLQRRAVADRGDRRAAAHVDPLELLAPEERRLVEALRVRKSRPAGPPMANRYKLPDERASFTHKFSIGGHEGYITVGLYEDGTPGEIFVRMAKEGSVIAGLMDSFATAISLALQHGVPLHVLIEKFKGTRFEPSGFTGNQEIPIATSIMDYLFRWLAIRFPIDGVGMGERHPAARDAQLDLPKVPLHHQGLHLGRGQGRHRARDPGRGQGPRVGPGDRRSAVPRVRHADGAQRRLPQVPELRLDERLLVGRQLGHYYSAPPLEKGRLCLGAGGVLFLVDFDNIPRLRRQNVSTLIVDILCVVPATLRVPISKAHFRFYGGWDTFNATVTQPAQVLSAQIQAELPLTVRLGPASANWRVTVTGELARSSLWSPHFTFVDTFRPRNPGQPVRAVRPKACLQAPCTLHTALRVLNESKCSAGCVLSPFDGVARDEQKQVDTAIVADAIHASSKGSRLVVIVSGDDDMWPGIVAALSMGTNVLRVYPQPRSQCSARYEASMQRHGLAYHRGQL